MDFAVKVLAVTMLLTLAAALINGVEWFGVVDRSDS